MGTLAGKTSAEQSRSKASVDLSAPQAVVEPATRVNDTPLALHYFSARDTVISGAKLTVLEGSIPTKYSADYSATVAALEPKALDELLGLVAKAQKDGSSINSINLEGRASFEGDPKRNQRLSQKRAELVAAILTKTGEIRPDQITQSGRIVSLSELDPNCRIDSLTKPSSAKKLLDRAKKVITALNLGRAKKEVADKVQPLLDSARAVQVRIITEPTTYASNTTSLVSRSPFSAESNPGAKLLVPSAQEALSFNKHSTQSHPTDLLPSYPAKGDGPISKSSFHASALSVPSNQQHKPGFFWGLGLGIIVATAAAAAGRIVRSTFRGRNTRSNLEGLNISKMVYDPVGSEQVPEPTGDRLQNMVTIAAWESEGRDRAPFELMPRVHELATICADTSRTKEEIRTTLAVEYATHMAQRLARSSSAQANYGQISGWVQQARVSADYVLNRYFNPNTEVSTCDVNSAVLTDSLSQVQEPQLTSAIIELQTQVVNGSDLAQEEPTLKSDRTGLALVEINATPNSRQALTAELPHRLQQGDHAPDEHPIQAFSPPEIPVSKLVLEHIYLNGVPTTNSYEERQAAIKRRNTEIESAELEFIATYKDQSPYFDLEREVHSKYHPASDALVRFKDPVLGTAVNWREAAENELTARIIWQKILSQIDVQIEEDGEQLSGQSKFGVSTKDIVSARAAAIQTQILAAQRRRKELMFA